MADHLLDIVTKVSRPTIRIDGDDYELRHPDELSMKELQELAVTGARLEKHGLALESGDLRAVDSVAEDCAEILHRIMPDVPKDVVDKLGALHVQSIMQAFTGLSRVKAVAGDKQVPPKSSGDSSDSMEAPRKAG